MKRVFLGVVITFLSVTASAQSPQGLIDHAIADLLAAKQLIGESAPIVSVPAGGDVQAALDSAPSGAVVQLTAGATYAGPIILRGSHKTLGGAGTITAPAFGVGLAIEGTEWTVTDVLITGDCNDCVNVIGSNVVLDGITVRGTGSAKRGIALNGANVTVRNSRVEDIYRVGQESQAIGGWNGPGPYLIENNYLEAAGVNIMFGGSDPTVQGLVPSDIIIRGNTIVKDTAWMWQGYNPKNLLELKNARRVTITGNLLQHSWAEGQIGYAVLFNVRNQDGACPWCTVEDVLFKQNTIEFVAGGFNLLGNDYLQPSARGKRWTIEDNDVSLCTAWYPGAQRYYYINDGPDDLRILNNRSQICPAGGNVNSFLNFDNPSHQLIGLVVTGNGFREGEYGIFGDSSPGLGVQAWNHYAPTGTWSGNTVVDYPHNVITYPAGTTVVP